MAALGIGGFSAAFALICRAQGGSGMGLHGGQGNPNWLGLLLAMTLPLSVDAALAAGRAARSRGAVRALTWAACAVQLPALYLSHSRVAWLALGVASVLSLILFARARLRRRAVLLLLALAAIGVVAALAVRARSDVPLGQALSGRVWIWQHSARAARDALPFGVGLGRFAHAYLDAQGEALMELSPPRAARRFINATTAHNEYLQAALESGPIAAFLLGAALLLAARAHARWCWPAAAAALGVCALTSFADSPLRQPAIAILVGLLLGVNRGATLRQRRRLLPTLFALATLGLLALLTRDALRGWLGTRERTIALDGDPLVRTSRLAKSARLDPASGETALALGLTQLDSGDARVARDTLERADVLFADTATRVALGRAELALSREGSAARAFERALAWNSGSFRARLGLAETHFRRGRLDDAEREATTARLLLPGDPRGRELLDAIREAKMDR
jgi:tetratricopeptide (TPR) repeat protein